MSEEKMLPESEVQRLAEEINKKTWNALVSRAKLAEKAIAKFSDDREAIADEIIRLAEADLSATMDAKIVKRFIQGYFYGVDDPDEKISIQQTAHKLRTHGIPVKTNREDQIYKIPEDERELQEVETIEKDRMIRKVGRWYWFAVMNPKKLEKIIEKKVNGLIERQREAAAAVKEEAGP